MPRSQRSWVLLAATIALVIGLVAVLATVVAAVSASRAAGPAGATTPSAVAAGPTSATPATPTATLAPSPPPAVCGSRGLRGPARPPDGAVVVATSEHLGRLTEASPPGTTFWLSPGRHLLGDGQYDQVTPKAGNRYVGAPGAVLDGRRLNQYAFTGHARDVRIEHLTVERFGRRGTNSDEAVVNHDAGPGWVLAHLTVRDNAGAGVMLGNGSVVRDSCLAGNGQYGFNAYSPDGVRDVTLRDNEITGNNTDDWEARTEGCGCTGGGKFWETRGATITGNTIHDNRGVGIWADTNNAGFLVRGNYFADNDDSAIVYETSYNAAITDNTFVRNALRSWRDAPGFPVAAVYVSESGSDARVDTAYNDTFEVARNLFVDNWGGVVAWENADRFAGSPANTSTGSTTLVNPRATVERCRTPDVIRRAPYLDDCRWKTQHLRVHDNTFVFGAGDVGPGCTAANLCGFSGLLANYGSYPDWSPYLGPKVQQDVALHQDNRWFDNTYRGPWRFLVVDQSTTVSWAQWQGAPYGQDRGSTIS
jgi:parallel beta-helix repeat protein